MEKKSRRYYIYYSSLHCPFIVVVVFVVWSSTIIGTNSRNEELPWTSFSNCSLSSGWES
jgi:hypothetical protein